MADNSVWPWQHARARHAASQGKQAVNGRLNVNLVKLLTGDGATRFDLT